MASFQFTWKKGNNPAAGKVFATKRKNKLAPAGSVIRKTSKKTTGSVNKVLPIGRSQDVGNKGGNKVVHANEPNIKFTHKYIKRKGKKDKVSGEHTKDKPVDAASSQRVHSLFSEKHKNLHINTRIKGVSLCENVFSIDKKFSDLDIHRHLVSNLAKHGFDILTKVQEKTIPLMLDGKNVLARSQTGSGKTLAYVVPILNTLQGLTPKLKRNNGLQAIVVVPNRELALQIHEVFNKLNTFQWIVVGHLCGGENRKTEKDRLRKGVHILIGTPGRLLDHILHTSAFDAQNVRCLVLDEADRLLDMGFTKDVTKFVEELHSHKKRREYDPMALLRGEDNESKSSDSTTAPLKDPNSNGLQVALLSATLTKGITELTNFLMKDHEYIDTLEDSIVKSAEHMVIPKTVKQEFLITFIKHRLTMLSALLVSKSKHKGKIFVFMATTQMVDYHYELFKKCLVKVPSQEGKLQIDDDDLLDEFNDVDEDIALDVELFKLHGNMDQNQRKEVFNGFRKSKKGILICTDVAARGIDVPEADCIIQYTAPQSDEDYLHRVGRTGRVGKAGSAVIFLTHEEQDYVSKLRTHKVFLQESGKSFLDDLCDFMMRPDQERAILTLQKRYEETLLADKDLHRKACFAYSSWSRFYSTYPAEMRPIFDFRTLNLGHYCTSFGLRETPTSVARAVRKRVVTLEPKKLNRKLANHEDDQHDNLRKRPIRSVSLATSEYSSGLEPVKKKKK